MRATRDVRASFALQIALQIGAVKQQDAQRLGEDKAREMWEKAEKQAEREMKASKLDLFF